MDIEEVALFEQEISSNIQLQEFLNLYNNIDTIDRKINLFTKIRVVIKQKFIELAEKTCIGN